MVDAVERVPRGVVAQLVVAARVVPVAQLASGEGGPPPLGLGLGDVDGPRIEILRVERPVGPDAPNLDQVLGIGAHPSADQPLDVGRRGRHRRGWRRRGPRGLRRAGAPGHERDRGREKDQGDEPDRTARGPLRPGRLAVMGLASHGHRLRPSPRSSRSRPRASGPAHPLLQGRAWSRAHPRPRDGPGLSMIKVSSPRTRRPGRPATPPRGSPGWQAGTSTAAGPSWRRCRTAWAA
jgi:hypothetical protein